MYDPADITGLSNLISDSVSSLVEICTANNFHIPRLDDNFTRDSEGFRSNKEAGKAVAIIAAAAFRLAAILLPPEETILQVVTGVSSSPFHFPCFSTLDRIWNQLLCEWL